jgi:hypothetical protein
MTDAVINPLRRAGRRHDAPDDCVEDAARLARTLNGEIGAIGDAVIVVSKTRSSEQVHCGCRIKSLWPVRPEGRCEANNVEVVVSDIFATPFEIIRWAKVTFPI